MCRIQVNRIDRERRARITILIAGVAVVVGRRPSAAAAVAARPTISSHAVRQVRCSVRRRRLRSRRNRRDNTIFNSDDDHDN